jgi:hypothetical protein
MADAPTLSEVHGGRRSYGADGDRIARVAVHGEEHDGDQADGDDADPRNPAEVHGLYVGGSGEARTDIDVNVKSDDHLAAASALLTRCVEDSLELRAAAILDERGSQLFATDEGEWSGPAAELWRLAGAPERDVAYLHVGTEGGEVLAVRSERGTAIATSDRFPLASLVLSDLRAVLRELGAAPGDGEGV